MFSNVSSNCLWKRMHGHSGCTFLICMFLNAGFFMSISYYKVKLSSFVYLFSTVPLQMCPQLVYICFASLCFQMLPQITCRRGCKVAPVALSWFFSAVFFKNVLKWCAMQIMIIFLDLFHCALQLVFSTWPDERMYNHT